MLNCQLSSLVYAKKMTENKESVKEKLSKREFPRVVILSVDEIFFNDIFDEIYRPAYQRPYRWQKKHVLALLNDLQNDMLKKENNEFYLGAITIHSHKTDGTNQTHRDIVDGLQRLTTLYLILYALNKNLCAKETPHFFDDKNNEGLVNIQNNYNVIKEWLNSHSNEDMERFIREQCFVVWNEVKTEEEAFQVFEGRNTKGKPLKPHDLLKAFHCRAISSEMETLKKTLKKWESYPESDLHHIFETLYRIRSWSKGDYEAWEFTKDVRQEFQGLDFQKKDNLTRIEYFYHQLEEKLKENYFIESELYNGQYFFDWVAHQVDHFIWFKNERHSLNENSESWIFNGAHAVAIGKFFDYNGAYRRGDGYCRAALKALLLLYRDRFLPQEAYDKATLKNDSDHQKNYEKLFNFIYRKRIEKNSNRDKPVTINKIIALIEDSRIFEKMNQSYTLEDFEKIQIDQIEWNDLNLYIEGKK